ncbi:hypothetical protein DFJ43DRAFT_294076 [Lentinula guzmanii]|uniref:TLC domain-containing protein n=1 Tax=Lentinula guzmanii TaxID=2804957 RepID=A0AA38JK52_9AGAR|nr:hypothetical protein DFJ43DRAFT_294076 [Lentinula guzmanii]
MFSSSSMISFPGYDLDPVSPPEQIQCLAFASSFLALILVYHIFARPSGFTSAKQVAWIITTAASFIMTIASVPFVWDYFAGRGDVKCVRAFPELAVVANRFFQAYLLADLSIGAVHYRSQLNLFTGWFHHLFYLGIVEYAIRQKWAHVFCLAACMEFPTFVLGIATLFPKLRSNVFFAVSFFLTRILFHVVICIAYFLPNNRPLAPSAATAVSTFTSSSFSMTAVAAPIGSIAPAVLLTCVFPMHASWFLGCLKGFKKRAKLRREAEKASRSAVSIVSLDIFSASVTDANLVHKSTPVIEPATSAPLAKASSSPDTHFSLRRSIPHARYLKEHYMYCYMRYSHYSSRYAHYRVRFRGLGLRGPASVKEQFSKRLPSLRPTLQRLSSLESLSSLSTFSSLPSPKFEMPEFKFGSVSPIAKKVRKTIMMSFPTREDVYGTLGLGRRSAVLSVAGAQTHRRSCPHTTGS